MKISGKLENTLIDLQKILHKQNQSIVNAKSARKNGQKCLSSAGSNRCQDTVAKPHKIRNSTQKNPEIVEILRNVSFNASKMTLTQSL